MKIGILGGTFDPPHLGHLIVAEHVRDRLGLDKIMFVPAVIPPHKRQRPDITPPELRLEMVRQAIAGNPAFDVSDIEIRRGGLSFTVDTLKELRTQYPTDVLYLLIGMDNVRDFNTWKDPEMIKRIARVVVMTRPGYKTDPELHLDTKALNVCDVPEIGISSREIRNRVKHGHSVRYMVPTAVLDYVVENRLYQGL
jgi:nicotinate-nucleotide adenylyltransferase